MKLMKNLLIGFFLVGALAACDETVDNPPPPAVLVPNNVLLAESSGYYVDIPVTFTAIAQYDVDMGIEDKDITNEAVWAMTTDNLTHFTMMNNVLTANEKGKDAKVTATYAGKTWYIDITSSNLDPLSVTVTPTASIIIAKDGGLQLKAMTVYGTVDPDMIDVTKLATWSIPVADPVTMSVDNATNKGLVTAVAITATTNITAKFGSVSDATATVQALGEGAKVDKVTITTLDSVNIPNGYSKQLTAMATYNDPVTTEVNVTSEATWVSSAPLVIKLNNNNVARAIAVTGTSDITAEFDDITSTPTTTLTAVVATLAEAVIVQDAIIDATANDNVTPTLTGVMTDGAVADPVPANNLFDWSVVLATDGGDGGDADLVATIDASTGKLNIKGAGDITITATLKAKGDLTETFSATKDVNITMAP